MSTASHPRTPSYAIVLLPHATASVRAARRRLAADLRARGLASQVVEDSVLVVSEILSNALKHAQPLASGKIRVEWDVHDGFVELAVTDGGGPTRPHPQLPSLSSLGGRGLAIVGTVSARWGVREDPEGTTVWAVLPVSESRRRERATPNRV